MTTTPCCSLLLIVTKRIVGRVTASHIASASAASFLPLFTYAGINRTTPRTPQVRVPNDGLWRRPQYRLGMQVGSRRNATLVHGAVCRRWLSGVALAQAAPQDRAHERKFGRRRSRCTQHTDVGIDHYFGQHYFSELHARVQDILREKAYLVEGRDYPS